MTAVNWTALRAALPQPATESTKDALIDNSIEVASDLMRRLGIIEDPEDTEFDDARSELAAWIELALLGAQMYSSGEPLRQAPPSLPKASISHVIELVRAFFDMRVGSASPGQIAGYVQSRLQEEGLTWDLPSQNREAVLALVEEGWLRRVSEVPMRFART